MYMPIGIFGVSVATAAIPDLARHAAAQALSDMRDDPVVGPAADADAERAGDRRVDGARVPIVELIFQHGAFGAVDT